MTLKILVTEGDSVIGNAIYNERTNLNFPTQVEWLFLSKSECDLKQTENIEHLFKSFTPDIVVNLSVNKTLNLDTLKTNINILDMCKKYKIKRLINTGQYKEIDIGSQLLTKESDITIINLIHIETYYENINCTSHQDNVINGIIKKCYKATKNKSNLFIKETDNCKLLYSKDLANIILQFIKLQLDSKLHTLILPIESEISISELVDCIISQFDFNKLVVFDKIPNFQQFNKNYDKKELINYLPNFKFTPFSIGLKKTIRDFKK